MTTDYYLIPYGVGSKCYNSVTDCPDKIKKITTTKKKAVIAANQYAEKLNNGLTMGESVRLDKNVFHCVNETPYSEARGFSNFSLWPCNRDLNETPQICKNCKNQQVNDNLIAALQTIVKRSENKNKTAKRKTGNLEAINIIATEALLRT